MKTRLLLLGVYFLITPIFILTLIFYQTFLFQKAHATAEIVAPEDINVTTYNATPVSVPITVAHIDAHEARVDVLKEFFARYSSPLEAYAGQIVETADRYGLDYRLLPAIAMQESTLCKRTPKNSFNCWGFGIYGGKVTRFSDYGQAIETITKTLARDYHQKGLEQPEEIMSRYTPANTNDWAGNVSYIMDRIASAL
ncbi:MAG TPA: hypothetical protein VG965_00650 [Patescibacteria group bacterium]|nr:hypothetical protein [Patescibacteria group bacterium]